MNAVAANTDSTRKTLLARVQSGDPVAWEDFYATYKRLIRNVALRLKHAYSFRLTDEDIADLIQNVMLALWRQGEFQFDPSRGIKFRTWFSKVVKNKLIDLNRKKTKCRPADAHLPDENELSVDHFEAIWTSEYQNVEYNEAKQQLKIEIEPETFRAFEMILEGLSPEEVARRQGIQKNNVYQIKNRCLAQLKTIYERLQANEGKRSARAVSARKKRTIQRE